MSRAVSAVSDKTPNTLKTEDLQAALKKHFGYSQFRDGQQAVIECLLSGRNAAAVFPTGGGKSLCYQLPALLLDGLTLVVSPLIALMKDQIDALTAQGIKAARLDSTLDVNEYKQVVQDIKDGSLRLLYVAPERFNNERFRQLIASVDIALFAVDEAHCISEWGHNFRPDYLKLVQFANECGARRILALTATATKAVMNDICKAFDIQQGGAINTGFYRSNLQLSATAVTEKSRDQILLDRIKALPKGPTIIYVTLQKTAEHVAEFLNSHTARVKYYHAGLKDDQRTEVQDWFINSKDGIVVATIAFGMGIDKSNIRYVFHYNLPKSLENYSQEIGRAGRDGEPSQCHLLACAEDLIPLENFIYGDTPDEHSISTLVKSVFTQPVNFDVSLYDLSKECDIRPLVLRTLLTQLELKKHITGGTPFYANYQFKPLASSAEILGRFDDERARFIGNIFRQAKKSRVWYQIDLDEAAAALNEPRTRLVTALDYLAEQDLLEVKVAGVRNRYSITQMPDSLEALSNELYTDSIQREEREVNRLRDCVDWVCLDACQTSALCERFDRSLKKNCGHCGWCDSKKAVELTDRYQATVPSTVIQGAQALIDEHSDLSGADRTVARVLCGLTSPGISRLKLHKSRWFGAGDSVPFPQVLSAVRETMKQ